MSSFTRRLATSKPKKSSKHRHTTVWRAELNNRIENTLRGIKESQMTLKLLALKFQIERMAKSADISLSLLDSPTIGRPAMSQETDEDGQVVFKCTMCPLQYKQLKRLQNHLKSKHGVNIELDDTLLSGQFTFSPKMQSTHEDAVPEEEESGSRVPKDIEKSKKGSMKRERESSDEEEDLEMYRQERDKRAKVFEDLEQKFDSKIGDKTLENALEEVESSINRPGATQALTENISQAIQDAEAEILGLEKERKDSVDMEDKELQVSLQRQLEVTRNILNCKDSQLIDQQEQIDELKEKLDSKDKLLKNKKLLIKEKDKEIRDIMKRTKGITKAAGRSPGKEELKEKCLRYERSIDNLNGRIKNINEAGSTSKDAAMIAKLEKTIENQIREIDTIRESLATFEEREIKLKRKIPCEESPCPRGRKKCHFSHDLEYKKPSDRDTKQELCKYFAGKGCNLEEKDCRFSHSMELLAKMEAKVSSNMPRAVSGANNLPLGPRLQESFNDTLGHDNLSNQRFRKITEGANNNMSVEITDDLTDYPPNDARRTLMQRNQGPRHDDWYRPNHNNRSGNGQGTSSWRSHSEAPREDQRPHYQSNRGQFQRSGEDISRRPPWNQRLGDHPRDVRRNYDRDHQGPSYHQAHKRRRQ